MSIQDSINSLIADEQKAIRIFTDALNFAREHDLIFDIEHYTNQIQLCEKRIGNAELQLHNLKITG